MAVDVLHTSNAVSQGGRNGHTQSGDGMIDVNLSVPKAGFPFQFVGFRWGFATTIKTGIPASLQAGSVRSSRDYYKSWIVRGMDPVA